MEANLADLQARAGGGVGDLVARYNAECGRAQPSGPSNVFEALFGGIARLGQPSDDQPQMDARFEDRGDQPRQSAPSGEKGPVQAHAGSYAVCVRTCDGSFFPVSYSGAGSRADSLEDVCRSLCPNADMALYSFPFGGTIEEAASPTGEPYANLPNAGKFEKSFDPSCSCRRKGQSWARGARRRRSALWPREARHSGDAGEVGGDGPADHRSQSQARHGFEGQADRAKRICGRWARRSPAPGQARRRAPSLDTATAPVLDANGADTKLSAAAATVSREGSGIAGDDVQNAKNFSVKQGRMVESTGPDGVKRSVRIVGPAL